MNNENFSAEASLKVIQTMIDMAKNKLKKNFILIRREEKNGERF